jgi:hypothetical protein
MKSLLFDKTCAVFVALIVISLSGCVSVKDDASLPPETITADQGMVALVIDSNVSFQRLKFKRPGDVFETVAAMNVPSGRSVRFISLPPGSYYWDRLEFETSYNFSHYVDFKDGAENLKFTVQAGKISYPGDVLIRRTNSGNYEVKELDHAAMLLSDINEQEKDLIARYGVVYTGKGRDKFYEYYNSLSTPTAPGVH